MKWLEIIIVRTAGMGEHPLDLLKQIAESPPIPGLTEAMVYRSSSIPGDVAVTLRWETERSHPWGSELGVGLVQELNHLGLVDHSIWIYGQGADEKKEGAVGPSRPGGPKGHRPEGRRAEMDAIEESHTRGVHSEDGNRPSNPR
jgi:hypothetical protein